MPEKPQPSLAGQINASPMQRERISINFYGGRDFTKKPSASQVRLTPRGAAPAAPQSPWGLRCPQPARPRSRSRRSGPGNSALAAAAPARRRHRSAAPTPTPGGMVQPARLGAPSAAAHPRWAEPSLLKRRGVRTGRPVPALKPPPPRPAASRPPAAAGQDGSGRLTQLLPARAGHRPTGLRSPFRRCGAGRRGACARRERTIEGGGRAGGPALRGLREAVPLPVRGCRLTGLLPRGNTSPWSGGVSQLGRDPSGSSKPCFM